MATFICDYFNSNSLQTEKSQIYVFSQIQSSLVDVRYTCQFTNQNTVVEYPNSRHSENVLC